MEAEKADAAGRGLKIPDSVFSWESLAFLCGKHVLSLEENPARYSGCIKLRICSDTASLYKSQIYTEDFEPKSKIFMHNSFNRLLKV